MIALLTADDQATATGDLADILHACVHDGASVGFILPFSHEDARMYWLQQVWPDVHSGKVELFAYRTSERILGTVQLVPAQMPNQPHRADVAKLLVHPSARRRGLARALMATLEKRARELDRSLLVLDTRSSDPSRKLYQSIGFETAGEIPNYCRNPFENRLEPTTLMFKTLNSATSLR